MPTWTPPAVEEEPDIRLSSWRVMELSDGTRTFRLFIGYNEREREGRVSSTIVSYENGVGVTKSGRTYKLVGRSGLNQDAAYVWRNYLHMYGIMNDAGEMNPNITITNVTEEYENNHGT